MKKKLSMIYQAETMECGLASLAMVFHYFNYPLSLSSLRLAQPVSLSWVSMAHLAAIAKSHSFNASVIKVEVEDLARFESPVILHWNLNHFVVLKRVKNGKFFIHDPARGMVIES